MKKLESLRDARFTALSHEESAALVGGVVMGTSIGYTQAEAGCVTHDYMDDNRQAM